MKLAIKIFMLVFVLNFIGRIGIAFFKGEAIWITSTDVAEIAGLAALLAILLPIAVKYDRP
jgi:F0F1-type ATP synthase membrane subunit a